MISEHPNATASAGRGTRTVKHLVPECVAHEDGRRASNRRWNGSRQVTRPDAGNHLCHRKSDVNRLRFWFDRQDQLGQQTSGLLYAKGAPWSIFDPAQSSEVSGSAVHPGGVEVESLEKRRSESRVWLLCDCRGIGISAWCIGGIDGLSGLPTARSTRIQTP